MKKFLTKVLAVLLICLFAISGFNFSIVAASTADLGETLSAMNVEASGKVSLMFYFKNLLICLSLGINISFLAFL